MLQIWHACVENCWLIFKINEIKQISCNLSGQIRFFKLDFEGLEPQNITHKYENTFDKALMQARAPENHKTSRRRRFYTDSFAAAIQIQTFQSYFACIEEMQEE